jgi:hypothetical protein
MGFTITSNAYLRSLYNDDRSFTKKSVRSDASNAQLVNADSRALTRGIKFLGKYDYGDEKKDTKAQQTKFYQNMIAFQDAYNNTLKSSHDSKDPSTKKLAKDMKKLTEKYSKELGELGVKFDSHGYMTVKGSAIDNIDISEFEETFGKDSDFMKDLAKISKKITKHVDIQA